MAESITLPSSNRAESLRDQVRSAVIWRSGTQIFGQVVAWASTFIVIRILSPADYGLFAMTQVILVLLNMLNGYGLASALVQAHEADPAALERAKRQLFGMLIVLNGGLGLLQVAMAPLAAAYFRHPEVATLLRVQALLYLATPLCAFPYALLARSMEFRRQAAANFISALAGALASLAGAYGGLGVWTLVLAPMVLFYTRGIAMMIAARAWMRPSFDFRGAGAMARFGGLMAAGQLFWFLQSQADVFIGGRFLDAHALGLYTTSLFLTQILVSKFVPPLNEIAFSAYARIQHDRAGVAAAFLMSVRIVLLVAMPFYLGLAVTAQPLVDVVLGPKWHEAGPVVATLALAMPFMTLLVMLAPACDASGRPDITARNGAVGAGVMAAGFFVGVHWGLTGLATAWLVAYPIYLAASVARVLPVIGVSLRALVATIVTPLAAALAMALVVVLADRLLPVLGAPARLGALVTLGGAVYLGWLALFARPLLAEAIGLVRNR